jgi:excisionase family DNA binding protein
MGFSDVYRSVLKDYPDVLTVEEMSRALGISTKTGYRLIRENKIESLKVGRSYRIPKAHLLLYMRLVMKSSPIS